MLSLTKIHSIEYLKSSLLNECDFLTHAFCTRLGGVSEDEYASLNISFKEGDLESMVLQNWNRLAMAFAIPMENFLTLNQVHGDDIFVIKPFGEYFPSDGSLNYDAIVTSRDNLAICIKTADCVPVFFVDRMKKIIAVVHAGWKSTALEITTKVIRLLQKKYDSSPRDILAAIGPAIGKCCLELDATSANTFFNQEDHEAFLFSGSRPNKWMLDLAECNRRQILNCGIPEANIDVSDLCTSCRQDLFFSHRGSGGITGRQVNFMIIKGDAPCRVLTVGSEDPRMQ
ncbi:MAG: peptidoglycan editing factor PgeF [Deltaproteobacteria bacterium]|nr:peptidoglycan editing factor PgeF [Deltaproteobacteria bacterium]